MMKEKNGEVQMSLAVDATKHPDDAAKLAPSDDGKRAHAAGAEEKGTDRANLADGSAAGEKTERERGDKRGSSARDEKKTAGRRKNADGGDQLAPNNLRQFRIEQMMSKAELARKAGLSVLTIDRIEKGYGCRMDTKRKILKALGLKLSDRRKVFEEE